MLTTTHSPASHPGPLARHLACHLACRLPCILLGILLFFATGADAGPLRITEIVTDPQADHGESAGGNGTPFDLVPGTGAITASDEFIELRNCGAGILNLTGHTLDFFDSTPSRYTFGVSTVGTLRFSPGSSLASVLPGAFVLLGNPPGAMNNTIGIMLRDALGSVLDQWDVSGDITGNATGADDEALIRSPDGEFYAHAGITPLADTPFTCPDLLCSLGSDGPDSSPTPTPEPGTLWLVALSAVAALAARRRRVRCATPRTPCRSPSRCANRPATSAGHPECLDSRCASQENA